jgi:tetratricopeptide (TPR) repeat protein
MDYGRQLRAAVIGLALLAAAPLPARADVEGCFADQSTRRIEACSEVIQTPGVDANRLSLAYAMRALAFSLRADYETAIRDYDAAIHLNPSFPVALNNRAWAYFKMGRPATGLPDVEASIALDPRSAHSYDTRAHIHQWMGRPDAALGDYDRAMYFGGERMVKLYQCGLQNNGLYHGPINGLPSIELRKAMLICVQSTECDPLPPDEECRAATS